MDQKVLNSEFVMFHDRQQNQIIWRKDEIVGVLVSELSGGAVIYVKTPVFNNSESVCYFTVSDLEAERVRRELGWSE